MGDDTALPPLAGRARPLYALLPAALRAGDQPADRPPARAVRHVAAHAARRPGAAPRRGPEAARGIELESFFLYPDALAQLDAAAARRDLRARGGPRGGAARASPPRPRPRSRAGREPARSSPTPAQAGRAPDPDAARRRRRPPPSRRATGLRTRATLVVETDEPREVHHFACLLGYGAEAICPRLALETVAALAAAGQDRRRPALARRGAGALPARRSRTASSR